MSEERARTLNFSANLIGVTGVGGAYHLLFSYQLVWLQLILRF